MCLCEGRRERKKGETEGWWEGRKGKERGKGRAAFSPPAIFPVPLF